MFFNKPLFKKLILIVAAVLLLGGGFLFVGSVKPAGKITWGVNFSQKHAANFGFDWQKVFLALIDDLDVKNIKLISYWDLIEAEKDNFDFADLDWQMKQAEEKKVQVMLVIGMKTPRWPECHLPDWAKPLDKKAQQKGILQLIEALVGRYKDSPALKYWQVENEPFFPYGSCPWADTSFLKQEVAAVRTIDPKHPVVISDTGEGSFWFKAAKYGDIPSTTLYKKVWFRQLGTYIYYPLPPVFYGRKAQTIKRFFGKEVICGELQAEPWGPKLIYDLSLAEQEKTMNPEQFGRVVDFARRTGIKEFYFWGAEWWYWLKENEGKADIWEKAKAVISSQ